MIDFHSHFLPGMDDGAANSSMAIRMLQDSKKQGVDLVVATPHFYCDGKSVDHFLKKRQACFNHLVEKLQGNDIIVPEIVLGCEVHLSVSLSELSDLDKLCIQGTRYILLEMPYHIWQPWVYDMVYSIIVKYKVIPIMAHIERYISINEKMSSYYNLLNMDVCGQANAEGFLDFSSRRFLSKLIDRDLIHVIGSDMHNMSSRRSRMYDAAMKIEKKFGIELLDKFERNSINILNNQTVK